MSFSSRFPRLSSGHITTQIIRSRARAYALWVNYADGYRAYVILDVHKEKHPKFQRLLKGDKPFRLTDFGAVLYLEPHEPDERAKRYFRERYGLFEDDLRT